MSNYRDNSINPSLMRTLLVTGEIGYKVLLTSSINFRQLTTAEYNTWVEAWKGLYHVVGEMSREVRRTDDDVATQADRHSAEHHLRVLANTLLNARQYAKDSRRGLPKEV